ncbi:aldo/keto reductase [Diaphorobacter ruginosibacter]|uniref:Aldo/keto reductase n=1 Tax=Diaphorobacter ruginosibacter TaxID=1715720 RepID=A0A7G9RLT8_9BURK|nr:aldo/keto reductase [Diaphorobacter ruginosibacter]QNN56563.1 aldo/keto reductase [Diaphorobacter ruginosibacter]
MKTVNLGRSGVQCEAVGLGTWAMGGWMWGGNDDAAAIDAIRASLDAGVRMIDSAPAYGLGHAEELVGKALAGRRHDAVIATKCGLVWHVQKGTHFFDEQGKAVYRYLGRDAIAHEVEASLRRLQTDYIDLYITHWQDATTPVAETMEALLALKREGKIRAIGVSNVDAPTLREYLRHGQVDAIQERYSLIDREIESELLPLCRAHDVAVIGYSSLALGLLSGPIDADREFQGDDQRKDNPRFSRENRMSVNRFFAEIEPLRARVGCTFAQLMIAWCTAPERITVALCGARTAAQARENALAGEVRLGAPESALIDAAAARHLAALMP